MGRISGDIFSKRNYSLILISVLLVTAGFILMTGPGNDDASYFNAGIYSFRRITMAPCILILGYSMMIFAIMIEPHTAHKKRNGRA